VNTTSGLSGDKDKEVAPPISLLPCRVVHWDGTSNRFNICTIAHNLIDSTCARLPLCKLLNYPALCSVRCSQLILASLAHGTQVKTSSTCSWLHLLRVWSLLKIRGGSIYELRELWRCYRGNGVVQRLILEIQHLRGFVREVEAWRVVIQRCWNDETGSKLVALECLRSELQTEIFRAGVTDASTPRPLPAFIPPAHDRTVPSAPSVGCRCSSAGRPPADPMRPDRQWVRVHPLLPSHEG
jgi:hypothetical protein